VQFIRATHAKAMGSRACITIAAPASKSPHSRAGQSTMPTKTYQCPYCAWSKATSEDNLARHITNCPQCRAQHELILLQWGQPARDRARGDVTPEPQVEQPFVYEQYAPATPPPSSSRRATVEDCVDEDEISEEAYARGARYVREYPSKRAGVPVVKKRARTNFEKIRRDQRKSGVPVYHPFESMAEWELARWAAKNLGHGQMDSLLALDAVRVPSTTEHTSTHG
jgi:hypothetical protein